MFKDFDYDNFPFIISSGTDFNYEISSIKTKIIPHIESIFKKSKHISLKAYDLVYKAPKKADIRLKELNDFVLINVDAISRNGSICICLLGEEFENLSMLINSSEIDAQNYTYFHDRLCDSVAITAKSGYSWIGDELQTKDPSLLELLSMQAGLMAKIRFPLFFFRVSGGPVSDCDQTGITPNDEIDNPNPRMERLKQKLIRNGLPIRFYGSADEFDEIVEKDLVKIINNYPEKTKVQDDFFIDQKCFEKEKLKCFTRNASIDQIISELDCFYLSLSNWSKPKLECSNSDRIDAVIKDFYRKDFSEKLQNAYKRLSIKTSAQFSSPCEGIRILILSGSRGSGKSTILANWLSYKEDPSLVPIVHYCDASSVASDLRAMLKRLINSIRSSCGFDTDRDNVEFHSMDCELTQLNQELLGAMLLSHHAGIRLLIVVDGLDQLGDKYAHSSQQIKDIKWIPTMIPDNVRIILTGVASDLTFIQLRNGREDVKVLETIVDSVDSADIIKSGMEGLTVLINNYSQICSENILRNIKDWSLIGSPIAQKIVAHVYHTFGTTPNWDFFIETITECHSIVELTRRVLKLWVMFLNWEIITVNDKSLKKKISQRKDDRMDGETLVKGWIPDCLSLIVLSRNGLFVEALPSLLKKLGYVKEYYVSDSYIWSLFHLANGFMLAYHNGKLQFSHSLCKEIVAHTFLAIANCSSVEARTQESHDSMYTDKRCKLHILLANLFWKRRHEHESNIEECIYHLDRASDYQTLEKVIFHPMLVLRLFGIEWDDLNQWLGAIKSVHKFIYYWQLLTKHRYDLVAKMRLLLTEYYDLCVGNCSDSESARSFQPRFSTNPRSDRKSSFQSAFTKKLRINYPETEERELHKSFSAHQSLRYLFLLGQITALMKQKALAREIYGHVIDRSDDDVFICHVKWFDIKLEILYPTEDCNNDSFMASATSQLDCLTSTILDNETDMGRVENTIYLRCHVLAQLCALGTQNIEHVVPCDSLNEMRSHAPSLRSVVLNSQLLELESDAINIGDNYDDIQQKVSLISSAIVTLETWTGPYDGQLAKLWFKLANCLRHGNYQSRLKAEACCRRAMSIWTTVRCKDNERLSSTENACHELLISLLLQDICKTSVSEAKTLLFTAYDNRVKTVGCYHPLTKRLAPLIKLVSSLEIEHLNSISTNGTILDRRSSDRIIRQSLALSKNESNSKINGRKLIRTDFSDKSILRSNNTLIRDSPSQTGSSLQFINKFADNNDSLQDDINWDAVADESGFRSGSRNVSAVSKRSICRSTRTELLSCDLNTMSLQGSSSSPIGSTMPRYVYSGHNSSLSYNDYINKVSRYTDSSKHRHKQVRFSAGLNNVAARQMLTDNIQAKLSQMQITKTNNWLPKRRAFSATFSRPYYSIMDPMTT